MQVTCGIDWAQDHHDIALVAADGAVIAQRRIGNDAAGFAELLAVLAQHDTPSGELRSKVDARSQAVQQLQEIGLLAG